MEDVYSFGVCESCKEKMPLKNGRCCKCQMTIPDFISNLFGGKNG